MMKFKIMFAYYFKFDSGCPKKFARVYDEMKFEVNLGWLSLHSKHAANKKRSIQEIDFSK